MPLRLRAPRAAQLDEKAYASLVAKRRMETGGFVVGDADGGCGRGRRAQLRAGSARLRARLPGPATGADARRRAAASYEDIGEEDDWETADRDSDGEEEEPAAGAGEPKKRKGDGAKARPARGAATRAAQRRARVTAGGRCAQRGAARVQRSHRARGS